jgi:hypothetical protein
MNRAFGRRQFLKHVSAAAAATVLPSEVACGRQPAASNTLEVGVEVEEKVYGFMPGNVGADPMWCYGSTCLVRIEDEVFASGLEILSDAEPPNNCRWKIFRRSASGWRLWFTDLSGRTREPAPIALFANGPLFVSANPTLENGSEPRGGPTRPEIFEFDPSSDPQRHNRLAPNWSGAPRFTEYSYRSLAADGANRHLIVFQNVALSHAEWAFRDEGGRWSAQGRLDWPLSTDYGTARPIRVCYPNVALNSRAVP